MSGLALNAHYDQWVTARLDAAGFRHKGARRTPLRGLAAAGLALATLMGVLAACQPPAAATPTHALTPTIPTVTWSTVDTSGQGAAQYRIPAVAVTKAGTVVACEDARRNSTADLPSDIDVVCRRSTDEGTSWGPQILAAPHGGGNTDSTAVGSGDGSLIYDATTGRLFLSYLSAPVGVGVNNSDTSTSPSSTTTVHPMIRWSDDDGQTWSAPTDLTASLKTSSMTGIFATSGHGIQITNGWLVQPYASLVGGVWTSWLAYSTDDGTTWQRAGTIGTGESENHVTQLATGTLLDDGRATTSGVYSRLLSTFNGTTWSTPSASAAMPDPQCNGDIIALSNGWVLASNPDSQTSRVNGVVRLSEDNGLTWPWSWSPTEASGTGYSAFGYSTMTQLGDGSIVLLYEHTSADNGRSLALARFTLGVFPA